MTPPPVARDDIAEWGRLAGTFDAWRGLEAAGSAQVSTIVFHAVVGLLALLAFHWSLSGQTRRAFLAVAALIAGVCLMTGGSDDLRHHVFRTAWLARQIRGGDLDLLVDDPTTGEVYPIFVFYSLLPYAPSVLLDLAGLSALTAYRVSLAFCVLLFAGGLLRLAEDREGLPDPSRYAAVLLLASPVIAGVFATRSALAEASALSLVPWAVLALRSGRAWPFGAILATQIALHPVVFPQSYAAIVLLAIALYGGTGAMLRRLAVATPLAFLGAAPFWVPQAVWLDLVGGAPALRVSFAETFHSLAGLFEPLSVENLGIAVWLAVLFALPGQRGWRTALLGAAFLLSLALQTEHLRDITMRIPVLGIGQFVWRLMSLSALLGFGLMLLGAWAIRPPILRALAGVSIALVAVTLMLGNQHQRTLLFSTPSDLAIEREYLSRNRHWGLAEFRPRYGALPELCDRLDDARRAIATEARTGLATTARYVALFGAPHGFVGYSFEGMPLEPAGHCGDTLLFGPLDRPGILVTEETRLRQLLLARVLLGLLLAGVTALAIRSLAATGRDRT